MENNKTRNLGLLTLGLTLVGLIANFTNNPLSLMAIALILGLILSIKQRSEIRDYDYFIAAILGGLASLYQAIYIKSIFSLVVFASTYIGYLGGVGVFRAYFKTSKLASESKVKSIIIGLAAGLILGFINLALGGVDFNFSFTIENLIHALMPGIYEEVGLRYLFYGCAIYSLRGEPVNKKQNILLFILMIMPHLLSHRGVGAIDVIFLFILFGLPMSLAQIKMGLSTAIIIHTVVDFIRFSAGIK